MHKDISKRTLLVISDTAVYTSEGQRYGFGPVVRELNVLTELFDNIIWIGCKDQLQKLKGECITNEKIKLVVLPSVKHKYFNFFWVSLAYPLMAFKIISHLTRATHIHTRGPSHPALIGVYLSFFDNKRIYWHKYAGDWIKEKIPATYALQRWLLKKVRHNNTRITINGKWENQNSNILTFENPCIYESEINEAASVIAGKILTLPLLLLFVGSLTENKGILELCKAISENNFKGSIKQLTVFGDGPLLKEIIELSKKSSVPILVKGFMNRDELKKHYATSDVLVLPSKSEGFPKVIAEAAAYGCIPVISAISAIPQYIQHNYNGILLNDSSSDGIAAGLKLLLQKDTSALKELSSNARLLTKSFTYEHFINRVRTEIYSQ